MQRVSDWAAALERALPPVFELSSPGVRVTREVPRETASVREMGALQRDGHVTPLEASTLVGRAPACHLRLADSVVSNMHASVRWTGSCWELQDLASTNGTYLNGRRLGGRERSLLNAGDRVAFGKDNNAWEVVDTGAPRVMAVSVDSRAVEYPEDGVLALPSPAKPVVTLFANAEGGWFLETEQGTARVADQQVIEVLGQSWRFCAPSALSPTDLVARQQAPLLLADLDVCVRVSGDEDHVELILSSGGKERILRNRACHYLLLTLARQRESADVVDAWGWIDSDHICKLLRVDEQQLSTDIFRLRQQFARAGVADYANIVERRTRPSKIRLGTSLIRIERG